MNHAKPLPTVADLRVFVESEPNYQALRAIDDLITTFEASTRGKLTRERYLEMPIPDFAAVLQTVRVRADVRAPAEMVLQQIDQFFAIYGVRSEKGQ